MFSISNQAPTPLASGVGAVRLERGSPTQWQYMPCHTGMDHTCLPCMPGNITVCQYSLPAIGIAISILAWNVAKLAWTIHEYYKLENWEVKIVFQLSACWINVCLYGSQGYE